LRLTPHIEFLRFLSHLLRDSAVIHPMQEKIQTILPRSERVSPERSPAATKSNPERVNPHRPTISVFIFMLSSDSDTIGPEIDCRRNYGVWLS